LNLWRNDEVGFVDDSEAGHGHRDQHPPIVGAVPGLDANLRVGAFGAVESPQVRHRYLCVGEAFMPRQVRRVRERQVGMASEIRRRRAADEPGRAETP
jgi:hypothetical protein